VAAAGPPRTLLAESPGLRSLWRVAPELA
jgi:hypothetical protein